MLSKMKLWLTNLKLGMQVKPSVAQMQEYREIGQANSLERQLKIKSLTTSNLAPNHLELHLVR